MPPASKHACLSLMHWLLMTRGRFELSACLPQGQTPLLKTEPSPLGTLGSVVFSLAQLMRWASARPALLGANAAKRVLHGQLNRVQQG